MPVACKIFPNANAARGAMNAVKATWVPPALTFVRVTKASLLAMTNATLILCADAVELIDGKWALIADHPGWKNDTIEESDIKRDAVVLAQAQAAPKAGK